MKTSLRVRRHLKLWLMPMVVIATLAALGLPRVFSSPPRATTYVVSNEVSVGPSSTLQIITVSCNTGDVATGGGFSTGGGTSVVNSVPNPFTPVGVTPTGWRIDVTTPTSGSVVDFVFVVCLHTP